MLPRHRKLCNFCYIKTNLLSAQIIYFVRQLLQSIVACVIVTKLCVPSSVKHTSSHARRKYIMRMVNECCITKCIKIYAIFSEKLVIIIIFIFDTPLCCINYKISINYHQLK